MKSPTRLFLIASSVACLTLAGGVAANAGSRSMSHNAHSSGGNTGTNDNGAANRPKSAGQSQGTVVRDHGDKPTKTTTTKLCAHGHHNCVPVRDHTSGQQGDWHSHGSTGPAGGPNSRKPPS
jgi:hypothetical protein